MQLRPALALVALALAAPGPRPPEPYGRGVCSGVAAATRVPLAAVGAGASARRLRPSWNWDYSDGGASWKLGQCGAASGQSPVDLSALAVTQGSADVLFDSYAVLRNPMTVRNDGRALLVPLPDGVGGISLGADTWDAYQLVVHAPSEHTFAGSRVALELQIYHAKTGAATPGGAAPPADATAVVAIGFAASVQASAFLDSLRQGGLPTQTGGARMVNKQAPAQLDFGSLFAGGQFFEYTGSLTTPPCSPGVRWFVRSTALPASMAALDEFKGAIAAMASLKQAAPGNARSLQPAEGIRVVVRTAQAVAHPGLPQGGAVDPEFDRAVIEAADQQESFEKSMSDSGQLSSQDVQYQECVREIVQATASLDQAEAQQKIECDSLAEAKRHLQSAGVGVSRLQALGRVQAQQQLCDANAKVASRLRAEVQATQRQCEQIKPR